MPVEILANQKDLHAVEHVARKVAGAVFYAPGQVSFKSGVTVSVDKKCFILIKEDADGAFYVSAANPETPGLRLTITLSRAGKQKRVVMQFEKGIAFLGRSKTTKVVLP